MSFLLFFLSILLVIIGSGLHNGEFCVEVCRHKISGFQLPSSALLPNLISSVKTLISSGWQPLGGSYRHDGIFYQSMVQFAPNNSVTTVPEGHTSFPSPNHYPLHMGDTGLCSPICRTQVAKYALANGKDLSAFVDDVNTMIGTGWQPFEAPYLVEGVSFLTMVQYGSNSSTRRGPSGGSRSSGMTVVTDTCVMFCRDVMTGFEVVTGADVSSFVDNVNKIVDVAQPLGASRMHDGIFYQTMVSY